MLNLNKKEGKLCHEKSAVLASRGVDGIHAPAGVRSRGRRDTRYGGNHSRSGNDTGSGSHPGTGDHPGVGSNAGAGSNAGTGDYTGAGSDTGTGVCNGAIYLYAGGNDDPGLRCRRRRNGI